jgi:hypothetical protein
MLISLSPVFKSVTPEGNFSGDITVCNFVANLMKCHEIGFIKKWNRAAVHRDSSGRCIGHDLRRIFLLD